ncbi:putative Actin [Blattamonas nauphoetae]|uniref:Actin n=1 Tax=Blattamonas nauphoetae TaxID=2049346 RepID=A0ABQ9YFR9_9EUKA|nr:putative Actin [Blattamonas nauphoetae]
MGLTLASFSKISMSGIKTIVLDNGSGYMKAGLANDAAPAVIEPTLIGSTKHQSVLFAPQQKSVFVGNEAYEKKGDLFLRYPIEHGHIRNWEDMETIWKEIFSQKLFCDPSKSRILVSSHPLCERANKEKLTERLFEEFKIPNLYVANSAILCIYATGTTSGLVVESGEGVTYSAPVHNGYYITEAVSRMNVAGKEITNYFARLLSESGHQFTSASDLETVKQIKENQCFFRSPTHQNPRDKSKFILPDGSSIQLGNERHEAAEVLYNPLLVGQECDGLGGMVASSLLSSPLDTRQNLALNIVVNGGTSRAEGFEERLKSELETKLSKTHPQLSFTIKVSENREIGAWIGGSVLASSMQDDAWMSKHEYQEYGAHYVHQKCL